MRQEYDSKRRHVTGRRRVTRHVHIHMKRDKNRHKTHKDKGGLTHYYGKSETD